MRLTILLLLISFTLATSGSAKTNSLPDTTGGYIKGFIDGQASVDTAAFRWMLYVLRSGYDPTVNYVYFSTSLTEVGINQYMQNGAVILYFGTKNSTTGKIPIRGMKRQ